MTLDRPAPAAPEPPRRSRRAWIVLALLAAVTAVIFAVVTAVVPDRDSGGAGSGTSTSAVSDVITPERLQQLWAETKTPCANPIMASGAPLNKYGLIGDAYITSVDVADQLRGVTARGGEDFVRGKLERVYIALLSTQSAMVDADNRGTARIEAAGGDRAAERVAVDMARDRIAGARDAFQSFSKHIYAELPAGETIPNKYAAAMFPLSAVCR
jgi:hypothetical protein